jgi:hypothetical protein
LVKLILAAGTPCPHPTHPPAVQVARLVNCIKSKCTADMSPRDSYRYKNSLVLILHKDCTITIDVADDVLWYCSQESAPDPEVVKVPASEAENAAAPEPVNAAAPEPVVTPAQPVQVVRNSSSHHHGEILASGLADVGVGQSDFTMETESAQVDEVARFVADICNSVADPRESIGKASEDPDIPACDACGKVFSANLVCTRCQSAFYCTKECQKKAWKFDRHKQLCGGMKEKCGRDAKRLMKALTRRHSEDCIAMERGLFFVLDGAGAYKAAIAEGLHEALRAIFRYDIDHVVELFRKDDAMRVRELWRGDKDGHVWEATRMITSSLFRGQRAEGRAVLGSDLVVSTGNV